MNAKPNTRRNNKSASTTTSTTKVFLFPLCFIYLFYFLISLSLSVLQLQPPLLLLFFLFFGFCFSLVTVSEFEKHHLFSVSIFFLSFGFQINEGNPDVVLYTGGWGISWIWRALKRFGPFLPCSREILRRSFFSFFLFKSENGWLV